MGNQHDKFSFISTPKNYSKCFFRSMMQWIVTNESMNFLLKNKFLNTKVINKYMSKILMNYELK